MQSFLTFFGRELGDHESFWDSDESYERKIHAILLPVLEACLYTPDTEPAVESEKTVEILWDVSDLMG